MQEEKKKKLQRHPEEPRKTSLHSQTTVAEERGRAVHVRKKPVGHETEKQRRKGIDRNKN